SSRDGRRRDRRVIVRRVVQRPRLGKRRVFGGGRVCRIHHQQQDGNRGANVHLADRNIAHDAQATIGSMGQPVIVPRAEHTISRKQIDPDALKVLYRLEQNNYGAYLVGGSVRDLLLGRRPKDFDIGTSAHPYQVKKLFRNCWIIGRRFRLAHVKFGQKTIEVATFRRQVSAEELATVEEPPPFDGVPGDTSADERDRLIHRDNTFGTPEEDAFRRDFTINALFYDIASFSI